jgi:hypothetical protein
MGITPSPWRPFFSVASVIGLINSMVAGALVGVAMDAFAPRLVAFNCSPSSGCDRFLLSTIGLGYRRFLRALERFTPIFPTEHITGSGLP